MTETKVVKRKTGADVEVDGNSVATFTKDHHAKPGEPFLAPPGAHTSTEEAQAIKNGTWHK